MCESWLCNIDGRGGQHIPKEIKNSSATKILK